MSEASEFEEEVLLFVFSSSLNEHYMRDYIIVYNKIMFYADGCA